MTSRGDLAADYMRGAFKRQNEPELTTVRTKTHTLSRIVVIIYNNEKPAIANCDYYSVYAKWAATIKSHFSCFIFVLVGTNTVLPVNLNKPITKQFFRLLRVL